MHNKHTTYDKNAHVEIDFEEYKKFRDKFNNISDDLHKKISTTIEQEISIIKKSNIDDLPISLIIVNALAKEIARTFILFLEEHKLNKDEYIEEDEYVKVLEFYNAMVHQALDLNMVFSDVEELFQS